MKALLLLTIPALFLLASCGDDEESTTITSPTGTSVASRTAPPPRTPEATPDPLDAVCAANPDPATDDANQVDIPNAGDVVASPVTVEGRVAAFEATFRITIFDAAGNTIADETAMSSEGQTLAPFQKDVAFSVAQETPACMWVYESSARDGSPIHVRQIPLTLLP
jgi:Immunoglobulin-like domain of bacterial spore germination